MRSLAAASNDEKTRHVNNERLTDIKRSMFPKNEDYTSMVMDMPRFLDGLLPETLDTLEAVPEYKQWIDPIQTGRTALFLHGSTGTGKTWMFELLRDKLHSQRASSRNLRGSTAFVAYHAFDNRRARAANESRKTSSIPIALKNMAVSIAGQSIPYAKTLKRQLDENKAIESLEDIEQLWINLSLSTFAAPPGSVLYLFFDGLEQEPENKVTELLNVLISTREQKHATDTLKIGVLLGADRPLPMRFESLIPTIEMAKMTQNLLKTFVEKEMKRTELFQDLDKRTIQQKTTVIESLPKSVSGRFDLARQKLERIREAVEDDAPGDQLLRIIEDEISLTYNEEGQKVLDGLQESLPAQQIAQLNRILIWAMYTRNTPTTQELEAALYLETQSHTLEPLAKKLRERFSKVFVWNHDGFVFLTKSVESTLIAAENNLTPPVMETTPLINLDLTIRNAKESFVRKFFWDMNEQMSTGQFDFAAISASSKAKPTIYVNKLEAHLTIARLCLKVLNEKKQEPTEALIYYAFSELPAHLTELKALSDQVTTDNRKMIGQGLVNFLSDPYYTEHDDNRIGDCEDWLVQTESVESVRFWLADVETLALLQPRERRWANEAVLRTEGSVGHMKELVLAIARKWLSGRKEIHVFLLFGWLEEYIRAVSERTKIRHSRKLTSPRLLPRRTRKGSKKLPKLPKLRV